MKAILGIAFVAAAIAIPFVAPALLGLAAGSLGAIAVTAGLEVGLALLQSTVLGPPNAGKLATGTAVSRLYTSFVTTEPRKSIFGRTALGTDLRYQAYTGAHQEYYETIVAHASHQINSNEELWIDNEQAWTSAGGVQGRFVGWLTVTPILVGTSSNGIAIDSVWTSACTLTGCAYSHLKFKILDPSNSNNQSPFQSGVSSRQTFRGNGALTYDPRLDSTVTGGSGTQRAATQSTWAWDANGSRNPALQLLWYLLGWQINGLLAVGMGLPAARIDLASFITAANHCDETVTLATSGTQPRYRSDGIVSEGDDRSSVIQNLCATMNAILRDNGGKISIQILLNDLATPVASLGLGDVLGSEEYDETQPLSQYYNVVRGRLVDPSNSALYQLTDYPQVKLTSPDGIDRVQTTDYPFVQDSAQVQRLAKLVVKRAQYQARYSATFGPNAWQTSIGNIVQFSHAGMNWVNKLFRVAAQSLGQNGQVKMTLLEESSDVYSWAAEEIAGIVGGTPIAVNPAVLPLPSAIGAAASALSVQTSVTIHADSTGTPKSGELPSLVDASFLVNSVAQTTGVTWSASLVSGNATFTISGTGTGALSITGPTDSTFATQSVIQITGVCNGATRTANVTVSRQDDPPTTSGGGSSGTSGSTTTLGNTTGTAYDFTNAVSPTLTATAGPSGQVACTAPLSFKRVATLSSGPDGTTGAAGKWQWRVVGGTFADITTEATSATNSTTSVDAGTGNHVTTVASLSVPMTKTGLTNGTAYEFRFCWRQVNVSGTAAAAHCQSGTMQAVGS